MLDFEGGKCKGRVAIEKRTKHFHRIVTIIHLLNLMTELGRMGVCVLVMCVILIFPLFIEDGECESWQHQSLLLPL